MAEIRPRSWRCRFGWHTPYWTPHEGFTNHPRCKRCQVPMWANYAGYGVDKSATCRWCDLPAKQHAEAQAIGQINHAFQARGDA